jgi:hypothetical protein
VPAPLFVLASIASVQVGSAVGRGRGDGAGLAIAALVLCAAVPAGGAGLVGSGALVLVSLASLGVTLGNREPVGVTSVD